MEFMMNLIVTTAVAVVLFFYFNNKIKSALEVRNLLSEVHREIEALVRELNQTTERNIGLIEERMHSLEKLLTTADQKMLLFSKEMEKKRIGQEAYNHLSKAPGRGLPETSESIVPEVQAEVIELPKLSAKGYSSNAKAPAGPRPQKKEAPAVPTKPDFQAVLFPEESAPPILSVKDRVLALASQGYAAELIAAQTGASLAEVDLILSLKRGRV